MKRSLYSAPDPFSLSPMLALLPSKGDLARLQGLTASLFARYEKVSGLLAELDEGHSNDIRRRLTAEQMMLKVTLEYLGMKT